MVANKAKRGRASGNDVVTVSDLEACYNSGDDVIALSCTVTTTDPSSSISGVGMMLNNSEGATLASSYTELSNGSQSVTPALNLPPSGLKVGDSIWGVVSGEAQKEHYFFEQELVIESC